MMDVMADHRRFGTALKLAGCLLFRKSSPGQAGAAKAREQKERRSQCRLKWVGRFLLLIVRSLLPSILSPAPRPRRLDEPHTPSLLSSPDPPFVLRFSSSLWCRHSSCSFISAAAAAVLIVRCVGPSVALAFYSAAPIH